MGLDPEPAVLGHTRGASGGGGRLSQSSDADGQSHRPKHAFRYLRHASACPIRVYVLPDNNPVHIMFCKQVLRVFAHQFRTAWDRLVYSGTGQAPLEVSNEKEMRARVAGTVHEAVVVASEEEMREKVAGTSGAIGYLTRTMVDESVRVLPVE